MNNEFMNFLEDHRNEINNVTADDVRESMARADEQEKALMIALHGLFAKKRKSTSDMLRAMESMDIMLTIIKHAAPENITKDMPDNKLMLEHGHALLNSIDNVISAIQAYSFEHEKFNEAVRQNCDEKESFKHNLENNE